MTATASGGSLEDATEQVLGNHLESLCTSTSSRNHPTSTIPSETTTDAPDNTTETRWRVLQEERVPSKPASSLSTFVSFTSEDGFFVYCAHDARRGAWIVSEVNANSNCCVGLSQKNKTELRDSYKSLNIRLSGHETQPQLTRKIKDKSRARAVATSHRVLNLGRHWEKNFEWVW